MFKINNVSWNIKFVDDNSQYLRRRDGSLTLGVTDWDTRTVYLSDNLYGHMLKKVVTHEIVHCVMISLGLYMDINQEEYLADFIATYGENILKLSDEVYQRLIKE